MKRIFKFLIACLLFVFSGTMALAQVNLTVAAASSLQEAIVAIGKLYEQQTGVKVVLTLAGSGILSKQIEQGAPIDIFASADQKRVEQIESLLFPPVIFAQNELVLASNNSAYKPNNNDYAQLLRQMQLIGIANPDIAPAGTYAKEVLQQDKLWDTLKHKFIYGQSVRQVLTYILRNEVDAGFIYSTDAYMKSLLVVQRFPIMVNYPIAVVRNSAHVEVAQDFIRFIQSPRAQQVLHQFGFKTLTQH